MFKYRSLSLSACIIFSLVFSTVYAVYVRAKNASDAANSKPPFDSSYEIAPYTAKNAPSVDYCVAYLGEDMKRMPEKHIGIEYGGNWVKNVSVYEARYSDGTNVGVWLHPDLVSKVKHHEDYIYKVADAIALLPSKMRDPLDHSILHYGPNLKYVAFASREWKGMAIYHNYFDYMERRGDGIEETVFHEAVHAILDNRWRKTKEWKDAQEADGRFLTRYAKENPLEEDLATSFVFVYNLIEHPEDVPKWMSQKIQETIPHRISVIRNILDGMRPLHQQIRPAKTC